MVIADFEVINQLGRIQVFYETFLLANTSMEIILEILFLILSNADIQFNKRELIWRSYTIAKAFPIT